jgi:hypothetical protein
VLARGKSPIEEQPKILDIFFEELHVIIMGSGGGGGSLRTMIVTWADLDPFAFILQFLYQFWIAAKLVSDFCEAISGSLPGNSTAAKSTKVAVCGSVCVCMYVCMYLCMYAQTSAYWHLNIWTECVHTRYFVHWRSVAGKY